MKPALKAINIVSNCTYISFLQWTNIIKVSLKIINSFGSLLYTANETTLFFILVVLFPFFMSTYFFGNFSHFSPQIFIFPLTFF